jgi:hypothetical protein
MTIDALPGSLEASSSAGQTAHCPLRGCRRGSTCSSLLRTTTSILSPSSRWAYLLTVSVTDSPSDSSGKTADSLIIESPLASTANNSSARWSPRSGSGQAADRAIRSTSPRTRHRRQATLATETRQASPLWICSWTSLHASFWTRDSIIRCNRTQGCPRQTMKTDTTNCPLPSMLTVQTCRHRA